MVHVGPFIVFEKMKNSAELYVKSVKPDSLFIPVRRLHMNLHMTAISP